ncbi:hypothetical protein D3C87_176800 [compost metagenome]
MHYRQKVQPGTLNFPWHLGDLAIDRAARAAHLLLPPWPLVFRKHWRSYEVFIVHFNFLIFLCCDGIC